MEKVSFGEEETSTFSTGEISYAAESTTPLVWRKSSRCDSGTCVEVAQVAGEQASDTEMAVRDGKDPGGPQLRFARAGWMSLMADLKNDRPLA